MKIVYVCPDNGSWYLARVNSNLPVKVWGTGTPDHRTGKLGPPFMLYIPVQPIGLGLTMLDVAAKYCPIKEIHEDWAKEYMSRNNFDKKKFTEFILHSKAYFTLKEILQLKKDGLIGD